VQQAPYFQWTTREKNKMLQTKINVKKLKNYGQHLHIRNKNQTYKEKNKNKKLIAISVRLKK